jgi:hypothetical protein
MLSTKSLFQIVREEKRFHARVLSFAFLFRFLEIFMTVVIFKWGLFQGLFGIKRYKQAVRTHSDYRKFDDMLRMVVDCSKDQANAIEFLLQDMHQHGQKLFYGVFYATHSLMACLFDSSADGNHIHFIDCDNGGYAMAAKALKEQMEKGSSGRFVLHHPILTQTLLEDDEEEEAPLDFGLAGGSNNNMHNDVEFGLSPFDDTLSSQFSAAPAVSFNHAADYRHGTSKIQQFSASAMSFDDASNDHHGTIATTLLCDDVDDSYKNESDLSNMEEAGLPNGQNDDDRATKMPKKSKSSKKKKKKKSSKSKKRRSETSSKEKNPIVLLQVDLATPIPA